MMLAISYGRSENEAICLAFLVVDVGGNVNISQLKIE